MLDFDLFGLAKAILLPPSSLLLAGAAGYFLCINQRVRAGLAILVVSWIALLILSTEAAVELIVYPLEQRTRPLRMSAERSAGAIVLLGAGFIENASEYGERYRPDYIALARIQYAARLSRNTGLPILVSGGGGTGEAMANSLEHEFRIPVTWREYGSYNTATNAAYSAKVLRQAGISRILLVTDAMHMPRSVLAFESCGIAVEPAPTMFLAGRRSPDNFYVLDFVPRAESLRRASYALYEWAGLAWYSLRKSPCSPEM